MRVKRFRYHLSAALMAGIVLAGGLLSAITAVAVVVALREPLPAAGQPRAPELVREMLFWSFMAWLPFGLLLAWWWGRRIAAVLEQTRAFARDQAWQEHPPRRTRARLLEVRRLEEALAGYFADLRDELAAALRSRDSALVLVNAVGEGILQLDGERRLVRLNPAAARLLGLPGEALGQAITSLIRQPELRTLLERPVPPGSVESTEIAVEGRRLFIVRQPLPGIEDGSAIVLVVDLTPRRKLEEIRRDFVANVSHELKTPLTAIRGYAETLQDPQLPAELRQEFLEATLRNAARMQRIIDDLLDLSRIESGGWVPRISAVDAVALAADAWTEFRPRAEESGIGFEVRAEGAPVASADAGGLRQVLCNLYDNALRYTGPGGRIDVRVFGTTMPESVDSARAAPVVVIEVTDTGTGIPAEALPRIFERFYRVDPSRSRAEGGTGLGLSIVKHLVEQMGGDVVAESRLGAGTTIRVTLPVAPPRLVRPHE